MATDREEQDALINACCEEFFGLMQAMYEDGGANMDTMLHALAVTVGASLQNAYADRSAAHAAAKSFADEVAQVIDLEAMEAQTGGKLQ